MTGRNVRSRSTDSCCMPRWKGSMRQSQRCRWASGSSTERNRRTPRGAWRAVPNARESDEAAHAAASPSSADADRLGSGISATSRYSRRSSSRAPSSWSRSRRSTLTSPPRRACGAPNHPFEVLVREDLAFLKSCAAKHGLRSVGMLLGIDLGAGSVKALLLGLDGTVFRGVSHAHVVRAPQPGWWQCQRPASVRRPTSSRSLAAEGNGASVEPVCSGACVGTGANRCVRPRVRAQPCQLYRSRPRVPATTMRVMAVMVRNALCATSKVAVTPVPRNSRLWLRPSQRRLRAKAVDR